MTAVGQRVGAILDQTGNVVRLLGYGVYIGDEIPVGAVGAVAAVAVSLGRKNPKIVLDDGQVVWGCECWWGPESVMKEKLGAMKVENVSIAKVRADFNKPDWSDPED